MNMNLIKTTLLICLVLGARETLARSQTPFLSRLANVVKSALRKHIESGRDVSSFKQEDLMAFPSSLAFPPVGSAAFYLDRLRVVTDKRLFDEDTGKQVVAIGTHGYKEEGVDGIERQVIWYEKQPVNDSPALADWQRRLGLSWSLESEGKMIQMFSKAGLTLDRLGMWETGYMDRIAPVLEPLPKVVFDGARPPRTPTDDAPVFPKSTNLIDKPHGDASEASQGGAFWIFSFWPP